MELVFHLYLIFIFLYIFHIKIIYFCVMYWDGDGWGEFRIPPPPGRVIDGGKHWTGEQFEAGGRGSDQVLFRESARIVGGSN